MNIRDVQDKKDAVTIVLAPATTEKNNQIVLEWTCSNLQKNSFYVIERSNDEKSFEVIGVIKSDPLKTSFEFKDEKPVVDKIYYRVRVTGPGKNPLVSKIVAAGSKGSSFCKFYPNPVDRFLIVRTGYAVELQINDMLTTTRIKQQLQPGLQVVDVSLLEKGLYVIIISRRNTNMIITEKLVKN
ncbi:MAG: T9SS type A sorting domain-containing protein [Chitinophagaceae bacterium]